MQTFAALLLFLPQAPAPAAGVIEETGLRAHLEYLASDELAGREAFGPNALSTAKYLREQLQGFGVVGAMPNGEHFQDFQVGKVHYGAESELTLITGDGTEVALENGSQFRMSGDRRTLRDLDGVGVQLVHQGSEPMGSPGPRTALLYVGAAKSWREFRKAHADGDWAALLHFQPGRKLNKATAGRTPMSRPWYEPTWQESKGSTQVRLYGEMPWIEDVTGLRLSVHREVETLTDRNVVGVIPGVGTPENPELASEVIVLSAHFDHLGAKEPQDGEDRIYNGADDDASGVAVLLGLAEAFSKAQPSARTVVFLFAAAEEKGILGTKYFVHAPPMAFENIVCNLNFEMLGRPDPEAGGPGKMWLTGFERSSLGPAFLEAQIDLVADPRLEQNFFERSDNIVFVKQGVVGQTLSSYNMHRDYHGVDDEADRIDFAHLDACAEAGFLAAIELTQGRVRPTWNPGFDPLKPDEEPAEESSAEEKPEVKTEVK